MTRLNRIAGSLLARLALGYILVAAVFASAWIWSLYGPLTQAAVRQQQRNLTAVAQSAALVTAESTATPAQVAKRLVARTDLRLTIVAADGSVIADSNFKPSEMENHLDRPEVAEALAGRVGIARRVSQTEGREELYVAVPASASGARVALRVSQPLAEIEKIAGRSRRVGLGLLGVALVIAIGIAMRATREVARPIQRLSESAKRMAAGELSVEIPDVPTDLEALSDALSSLKRQMRARLEALEGEKLTLRSTLDGLPDAVFVFDGDRIRLANKAAGRLFRRPVGGWRDTPLSQADLPGGLEQAIIEHMVDTTPTPFELGPDPTGRTLRVLVAPLDSGADSRRTIVSISDITQRARLDSMRRDFVANASHELKTPVSAIRLLAQTVGTAAGDGDVDQALVFAQQIDTETERLQHLVGDLLDLSRLETAPAPGTVVDVRQAVDRAIVSHRSAAARRDLALDVDLSAVRGADVFVTGDPTDLAIAIDNLLDNAIAYTESGTVSVTVNAAPGAVRIAVADTGPGIAPEHQPRIFERFYRVDRGRSRDVGGTGLGLALVRHVVERSGGTVSLVSEPGEGATFTLTLPRAL